MFLSKSDHVNMSHKFFPPWFLQISLNYLRRGLPTYGLSCPAFGLASLILIDLGGK